MLYVAPGGSDANDCLAPESACETIGAALGKASAGGTIHVAYLMALEKQGIKFKFRTTAENATVENGRVKLKWKAREGADSGTEDVDKVLVCVGRRPVTVSKRSSVRSG